MTTFIRATFLSALVALGCVATVDLTRAPAHACSCMPVDAETAFDSSLSVFEGQVLGLAQDDGSIVVTLGVVRTWKGANEEQWTVRTASNSAACGFGFEEGKSYLVYTEGEHQGDGERVSLCGRTAAVEDAQRDLDRLGAGVTPVNPSEGYGSAPVQGPEPAPGASGCASCAAGGDSRGAPGAFALAIAVALFLRTRR